MAQTEAPSLKQADIWNKHPYPLLHSHLCEHISSVCRFMILLSLEHYGVSHKCIHYQLSAENIMFPNSNLKDWNKQMSDRNSEHETSMHQYWKPPFQFEAGWFVFMPSWKKCQQPRQRMANQNADRNLGATEARTKDFALIKATRYYSRRSRNSNTYSKSRVQPPRHSIDTESPDYTKPDHTPHHM